MQHLKRLVTSWPGVTNKWVDEPGNLSSCSGVPQEASIPWQTQWVLLWEDVVFYSEAKGYSWKGKNVRQIIWRIKSGWQARSEGGPQRRKGSSGKNERSQSENVGGEGCCTQFKCMRWGCGESSHHWAILRCRLGFLQFNSILTLPTWR